MELLSIYSITDCNEEAAMGFLAISGKTDCNGKAAMGFLTICSNTDCKGEAAMEFLTIYSCLLYTSPSPRDLSTSRMPSSA